MEKIKTKGKLKLFLCCSSIELKGKKKKNNNNTEESSPDNEHEEIFAAVFGATWSRGDGASKVARKQESIMLLVI
ncbi:hypothetical protein RHMOL_Rhmol06G0086800 [Rhododendron molle]|uniref:Uncharacterized protein n=1 Tax=Rhododendron molle TaxID=49168 RepID=A0ACC0NA54_RHOML|nr:hypothetical protein RHMOL_Rhmol06G0086800 [Rhododendron molle]